MSERLHILLSVKEGDVRPLASVMKALGAVPFKPNGKINRGPEPLLHFDMSEAAAHFGVSRHVIAQRTRKSNGKND